MSNDPPIDATDPAALSAAMECCNNSIIAARLGDPPDGMVAGMSPVGISSGGQVCAPQQSAIGMAFVEELGPAVNLPSFKSDFAALGHTETSTPAPDPAPEYRS